MTQGNRIILNTIATYGRSMFGIACGIFSARWVLEALGHEDFGLYTVVGAMAIFLSFINIQFSGALSRFYAFSIGRAEQAGNAETGLNECRAWFTTAVLIHTILPLAIVSIGWPIGEYAINHAWLEIPERRVDACIGVWRIVCASSFFGMFGVPFQAMYTARQYIAELTAYSFLQTLAKTVFIYFMTLRSCDWLVRYATAMALVAVVPQGIICVRSVMVFKECRIVKSALGEFWRIRDLACYALWTAVGGMGFVASHQCMSILINNFYGARVLAGFGVSQTVAGEAASLTGAMQGAFSPAITSTYGAGKLERYRGMSFWACKAGTLLTLIFAVPMALEIDQILMLWLKDPPPMSAPLCICTLAFIVAEKLTCGHITAVNATGEIAKFQMLRGMLRCLVIPLALIPAYLNFGVVMAAAALPISAVVVDFCDVFLARRKTGMSPRYWMFRIVLPICLIAVISAAAGFLVQTILPSSFMRIVITTITTLATIIPLSWGLLLSHTEREMIRNMVAALWIFRKLLRLHT